MSANSTNLVPVNVNTEQCRTDLHISTNWSQGWLNPLVPYYRDLASHWKVSEDYWRYTFATVGDKITSDYKTEYRTELFEAIHKMPLTLGRWLFASSVIYMQAFA